MFWNKNISQIEIVFFSVFIGLYIIYIFKILYISMKMKLSARAILIKFIPRVLAIMLLLAALFEPTFGISDENSDKIAASRTLMFVVDVSNSMNATDIAPNRLERAKYEIKNIINFFSNDRFGLISFAANSQLDCPVTTDKESIFNALKAISSNNFANTGTNLNSALLLAVEKLSINLKNTASTPVIVLYTDGEDFSDLEEQFFTTLRRNQIKFLCVGIGTKNGSKIYDEAGKPILLNSKQVVTKIEKEYLISLADNTNGFFIDSEKNINSSQQVIKYLENVKTSNIYSDQSLATANKYAYALILALFIICIDILFSIKIFSF